MALSKAKEHGAEELASGAYKKALILYKEGEDLFEERLYELAAGKFLRSRRYSEKAENISRLKKYKRGDFSN